MSAFPISGITFSAFIQYEDYSAFATAMEALTRNKLMYKPPTAGNEASKSVDEIFSSAPARSEKKSYNKSDTAATATKSYVANIKVDFDR